MERDHPQAEFQDGSIQVEGHRVHYLRAGVGRPLLLIHGIVGSCANWKRNIPALAQQSTVYALDLLGMGHSERVPKLEADLEKTANRVLATMDALHISEADIAGASHGGAVAMMTASMAPARIRSLVLFAPANPYSSKADWMVRGYGSKLGGLIAQCAPLLPRSMHQIALGRMFGDSRRIPGGCLEAYRETLKIPGTMSHVLSIVHPWFQDMEKLRTRLTDVKSKPILLIWGDKDRVVSLESAKRMERELGAQLVVIPGGGHLVFEEFAEKVNAVMTEWLYGVRQRC